MALILKKVRPLYTKLITTANRYEEDVLTGGILDKNRLKGYVKEYQTVIRVGNTVRNVKEGELVFINPTRYIRKKYDNSVRDDMDANPTISIEIPTIEIEGKDYFMIDESDIGYIIEDYEEVEDKPQTLILPRKNKILDKEGKPVK